MPMMYVVTAYMGRALLGLVLPAVAVVDFCLDDVEDVFTLEKVGIEVGTKGLSLCKDQTCCL